MSLQTSLSANNIIGDKQDKKLRLFLDRLFSDSSARLATFSFPIKTIDPLVLLDKNWQEEQFQFYWEHPSQNLAIAAQGAQHNITGDGYNRFQQVQSEIESIKDTSKEFSAVDHRLDGMTFLGGFSFFDTIAGSPWQAFKAASFTIPEWTIIKDEKCSIATFAADLSHWNDSNKLYQHLLAELEQIKGYERNGATDPEEMQMDSVNSTGTPETDSPEYGAYSKWETSIGKAKQLITDNKFDKIVLARQVNIPGELSAHPPRLINNFRRQYPNCYNFLVHQPQNVSFLGSTPERLGSTNHNQLLTEALAGSIGRGQTDAEDLELGKHLAESSKNVSEHHFVVKDIEERLRPLVQSMDLNEQPGIKKLSNVQHLSTPIRAELNENTHILDVVEQLHPTPAVGGYPWEQAAPFIKKLENFERGWYSAPVGWFNSNGHGTFAVGIRSGLFTEEGASLYAGCGIVANSDAKAEWEETNLKLKPMLSALPYD